MNYTDELNGILDMYRLAVEQVERNKKPYDGLLGMGRKPSDDACHEQMDHAVEELMQKAAGIEDPASAADAAGTDALLNLLMRAAREYKGPEYARIALTAAQRHGIPLISGMTAEGRKSLRDWYDLAYPRRMRFPIQKTIMDALKK